ncbi:F-box protein At3g07870-like [Sesamum indicum]|uniref:F-box protein At3g07870-like n=1 Tax=Sesamum indicum TaxID=4182 RepID=A0A6I9URG8_SESIN|nr:F-box protein At3g07870-like [Sesamum indicum]
MNQELFTNLPAELIINILSRLPIRTIISCKCVCKSWLNLLDTPEFARSHLSRSVPGLILWQRHRDLDSEHFEIFEFEDELDLERHDLHYNPVTKISCREFINEDHPGLGIQGSADGLVCFRKLGRHPETVYVCNPITRDYIQLPTPGTIWYYPTTVTYGFGASKTSGQHKVVRIYHECRRDTDTHKLLGIPKSECWVYTLGTGSWRRIAPGPKLEYNCRSTGAFLNGNLHWLVADLEGFARISCLDLETEVFSTFSAPSLPERSRFLGGLTVLGDCLCMCDNTSDDEIVIWLMKEYGVEKSWTKEFVISKVPDYAGESYEVVYPIKIFRDGDILMAWEDFHLFHHSIKNRTTASVDIAALQTAGCIGAMLHNPTFLSLKSFATENVCSF